MPQAIPERLAHKANQLYWETKRPAGQLADELGISRSKFYAMIEPLQLDQRCDACGGPLVFSSRTDREASRARCVECGATVEVSADVAASAQAAEDGAPVRAAAKAEGSGDAFPSQHYSENLDLWVTAAAGVVAGLLTAAWFRRR